MSAEVFLNSLLNYIRQWEKLIVVTAVVTLAGVVLYAAEDRPFDYGGLPAWARPTALIVWTVCAAHVVIRLLMGLWKAVIASAHFIASIPLRRRQAAYIRPYIDRLLATEGVEREMLCYALHRGENHIWVHEGSKPRWLTELRAKGLLEFESAQWGPAHYCIHPTAWNYMKKYPNKFINVLEWPDWPWAIKHLNEDRVEMLIEEQKEGDPKSRPRLRRLWDQITWRSTPRALP